MKLRTFLVVRTLVFAAGALALSSGLAQAQSGAHGNFTLAKETHWLKSVLAPGHYEFSTSQSGMATVVTVRAMDGKWGAMFLAQSISSNDFSDKDQLVLQVAGGESFVSALNLGDIGLSLHYAVPERSLEVAARTTGTPGTITASAK